MPRLLDVFCCEGGASTGYSQAGFEVTGVDLFEDYSQKRYPFRSVKWDALDALKVLANSGCPYDVIVASPPCQRYSITNAARKADYPDLIGSVRDLLIQIGKPYVIENVVGAPLVNPALLCGTMFGLSAVDDDGEKVYLQRHRLFESNVPITAPEHSHPQNVQWAGSYGGARRDKIDARHVRHGGYVPSRKVQQDLLGIDWMTIKGMHQSIPPSYTYFLGQQLMAYV